MATETAVQNCTCHIFRRVQTCAGPPPLLVGLGLDHPLYERAVEMVFACYAEAGQPLTPKRASDGAFTANGRVDHDVTLKARELVYGALGIEWQQEVD